MCWITCQKGSSGLTWEEAAEFVVSNILIGGGSKAYRIILQRKESLP
jgi:hypothetical protein